MSNYNDNLSIQRNQDNQTLGSYEPISQNPVNYPDGSVLTRTQNPPHDMGKTIMPALIAASIIGVIAVLSIVVCFILLPASNQNKVEEYCQRSINFQFPLLSELYALDNASVMQYCSDKGYIISKVSKDDEAGLDLFKAPSDLSEAEAQNTINQGLTAVSALELAHYLNGSWRLTYDRDTTLSVRLRYADFSSGSIEASINSALKRQSIPTESILTEGTDDNGNTYKEGKITISSDGTISAYKEEDTNTSDTSSNVTTTTTTTDDETSQSGNSTENKPVIITWRISCIEIDEVYSQQLIDGIFYVGIRFTPETTE